MSKKSKLDFRIFLLMSWTFFRTLSGFFCLLKRGRFRRRISKLSLAVTAHGIVQMIVIPILDHPFGTDSKSIFMK